MFQLRLKQLRENAEYKSQQAFADKFGVKQSTVGNWEAGKRIPDTSTMIKLANFFDVSVDYLLCLSDSPLSSEKTTESIANLLHLNVDLLNRSILHLPTDDAEMLAMPVEYVPATIPCRLQRARVAANLSKADLAKSLSIPISDYSAYELGEITPPSRLLYLIAQKLNVAYDWLSCTTEYIDPMTKKHFDPGIYRPIIDSVKDPIENKASTLSFTSDISQNSALMLNFLNRYSPDKQAQILDLISLLVDGKAFEQDTHSAPQSEVS